MKTPVKNDYSRAYARLAFEDDDNGGGGGINQLSRKDRLRYLERPVKPTFLIINLKLNSKTLKFQTPGDLDLAQKNKDAEDNHKQHTRKRKEKKRKLSHQH